MILYFSWFSTLRKISVFCHFIVYFFLYNFYHALNIDLFIITIILERERERGGEGKGEKERERDLSHISSLNLCKTVEEL